MTEYYRVPDMHRYDDLVRGMGYLTFRHGKIDRLDSMSEYWLSTEARLREDFNVFGLRPADLAVIQRKTGMKGLFAKAGVPAAPAHLVRDAGGGPRLRGPGRDTRSSPSRTSGVGASRTWKLETQGRSGRLPGGASRRSTTSLEGFVEGDIVTYDGLADRDGHVVFDASLRYSRGIMEVVNEDTDVWYHAARDIEPDLADAGRRLVDAFDIRERFFHIEFFRRPDGSLLALEVNVRPPGGMTVDMWNYQNDADLYRAWADLLVHGNVAQRFERPCFVAYVGRKDRFRYALPLEEVLVALRVAPRAPRAGQRRLQRRHRQLRLHPPVAAPRGPLRGGRRHPGQGLGRARCTWSDTAGTARRWARRWSVELYGHGGRPVLAFPSQDGRMGDFAGFGMIDACGEILEAGRMRLVAVDGIDWQSWTNAAVAPAERARRHLDYDRYVMDELVPFVRKAAGRGTMWVTGCSMGAFHAANFFFRRPDVVRRRDRPLRALLGRAASSATSGTTPPTSTARSSTCPASPIPTFLDRYRRSAIAFGVGQGRWEEDCLADTRALEGILREKGVPAWFDYWGGDVDHDWPWWRRMLPYFLDRHGRVARPAATPPAPWRAARRAPPGGAPGRRAARPASP